MKYSIAVFLMCCHVALVLCAIHANFAVFDEVGHLGAGISHWRTKRFTAYRVNPPLPRMLATLPLLHDAPEIDWPWVDAPGYRPEWGLGRELARKTGTDYFWLVCRARYVGLLWAILAAWIIYRWSSELFGLWGGNLSLALWCFDPTVIAFAAVTVPDMPATAMGLAVWYAFYRHLEKPSWEQAFWVGLLLGVALLTKFTWLICYPLFVIIGWWRGRLSILHSVFIFILPILIVNIGYGFERTCQPLGQFVFVSRTLSGQEGPTVRQTPPGNRFHGSWPASVPIPLPADWVEGIDIQRRDFEGVYPSYLRGEWSEHGWWYYYLYAMAVKMPLGTLLILLTGVLASLVTRGNRCLLLATPAFCLIVIASCLTGLNGHLRYVLPAWPFLFILAGSWSGCQGRMRILLCLVLVWVGGRTLLTAPDFLSHFNELVGGSTNGASHLLESNLDWGQDVYRATRELRRRPDSYAVAFYSFVDPGWLGMPTQLPPLKPQPGYYALSVNFVQGAGLYTPDGAGNLRPIPPGAYTYFQRFRPIGRIGTTILLYHLRAEEIAEKEE